MCSPFALLVAGSVFLLGQAPAPEPVTVAPRARVNPADTAIAAARDAELLSTPVSLDELTEERAMQLEQAARKQLDALLTVEERTKYQARLQLVSGLSEFVEIVRYARENEIDLLVLGTHGRGAIAHMLIGSVAEKVVRKAPCPVLTVRHPEHEFIMP